MASKWFQVMVCVGSVFFTILTVTYCRSVTSSSFKKEFKLDGLTSCKTDCDKIVSVVQSAENDYIYLATKYTVKKLDSNLNPILDRKIQTYGPDTEISFMLLRGSDLIICLYGEEGICELWDVSTLHQTIEGHNRSMIINPWESLTVAWIAKTDINGSDVMHVAIPTTYQKPAVAMIPLLSTRILPQRSEPHANFLAFIEDGFGSPKSFLPPIPCLTTEIEPVYGFSTSHFNYFLKRHRNVQGRMETKLARICSGSPTYRSLIELPVECRYANDNADSGDTKLSSAYFTNEELYAVFTTTSESEVKSIVCKYNIDSINQQFTERRKECLLGITETTELEWYQYNTCPSKPVPSSKLNPYDLYSLREQLQRIPKFNFNISQLDDPDFCYDLDTAYPLGGSKPIVEKPLDNLKMKEVVTSILVLPTPNGEMILLGDKEGYIHKIPSTGKKEVLLFDLDSAMLSSNGLFLSNDKTTVYATSSGKVMALPLIESWTTTQTPEDKNDDQDDGDGNDDISIRNWVPFACIAAILLAATILTVCYIIYKKRK
ncbi:Plexin-B2 [Holothuria leucospilota]|uniref:Plexin-B2 n=1 Tax=Holothuria leucospilota TaxID=206669 RepID=A0A9Q1BTU7_HOLLE|nr:Plexin-B2 [Holothuria leucospilota]